VSSQTINPPDLDDVLAELKNSIFANLNCVQIGKIEKVNDNQTVEILIQVKRRVSGTETRDYPLLVDCPYFVLSGGGSYIDMPIAKGDYCLILFNDRNIDNWWSTENVKEPSDRRKHNLSDGIALVGINPASKAFTQDGTWLRVLGTSGPGSEAEAARLGDEVRVTIPAGTFIVSVSGGSGSPAVGVSNPLPIDVDGTIISASGEVKIG
jgi:hypothetical protein